MSASSSSALPQLSAFHHQLVEKIWTLGIALPDTFGQLLSQLQEQPRNAELAADAAPALAAYVAFMRSLDLYDGPPPPTYLARDTRDTRSHLAIGGTGSILGSAAFGNAYRVAKDAVTAMVIETAMETGQNTLSSVFGEHKEVVVQSAQRFAANKINDALLSNNVPMVLTALFLSMLAGIIILTRTVLKLRSAKADMRKELTAALAELTARKAADDTEVQAQAKALAVKMAIAAAFTSAPPPVAPSPAAPKNGTVRVRNGIRIRSSSARRPLLK